MVVLDVVIWLNILRLIFGNKSYFALCTKTICLSQSLVCKRKREEVVQKELFQPEILI